MLIICRWIDLLDKEEISKKRIHYLEDRHWIDKQTKTITFELLVLNNQHEPLVCEMKLVFKLSRGASSIYHVCVLFSFN